MKKTMVMICCLLLFLCNAQLKKINFLIMIDEKPCLIVSNLQIESQSMKSINANYNVGAIDISEDNYSTMIDDKSSSFNLTFEAILSKNTYLSIYSIIIPKFFFNQKYIIVNIFNMDNKIYRKKYSKLMKDKSKYYVVIETPNSMRFN
ncbi:hypothetical protein [Chryseobacterium chendengshani]|uniref:hypothetical protein n=1 Tax=Chryseobacterium sp. LJ756 TaxID=2864113 RepID=UPI001C6405C7|nr:hypothetical protein [Chryseobacterium sp. LJ756]MBW7674749.1 hypothetical protein [Chryseobacterium sp. LJ756]